VLTGNIVSYSGGAFQFSITRLRIVVPANGRQTKRTRALTSAAQIMALALEGLTGVILDRWKKDSQSELVRAVTHLGRIDHEPRWRMAPQLELAWKLARR
jgi:hypothetical protein